MKTVWIDDGSRTRICSVCGFQSWKGDYALGHRPYHAEFVRINFPQTDPRLGSYGQTDIVVNSTSPKWLHQLVYERARDLRRLEGYDFTQWPSDHAPNSQHIHALLLIEPPSIAIGILGFDWMKWTNIRPGWHLNFVWISQAYRRKGLLAKRWPHLIHKYGWFTIEHPISQAMRAFLFKVHHRTAR